MMIARILAISLKAMLGPPASTNEREKHRAATRKGGPMARFVQVRSIIVLLLSAKRSVRFAVALTF